MPVAPSISVVLELVLDLVVCAYAGSAMAPPSMYKLMRPTRLKHQEVGSVKSD